jgi:hypothetical protein
VLAVDALSFDETLEVLCVIDAKAEKPDGKKKQYFSEIRHCSTNFWSKMIFILTFNLFLSSMFVIAIKM